MRNLFMEKNSDEESFGMKKQYTVHELAVISGVSVRTLHYYDQLGLLHPMYIAKNGYRIYGSEEVDKLQRILFYRELKVPLKKIRDIMNTPDYDKVQELEEQLEKLLLQREQLELLIQNITKTIRTLKGEDVMSDIEKFEGFKQKMIDENEAVYGKEIRSKYGDEAIDASNAQIKSMSREQWNKTQKLEKLILDTLKEAFRQGNPAGEAAQRACDLHRQWLCMIWKKGTYSKEAHRALAEGYVADERFTAYYDKIAPGCTRFFRDAIVIYCEK